MSDAKNSRIIKLKGSETEREFEISAEVAMLSDFIRDSLEDDDEPNVIELPHVSTDTLEQVIDFMVHYAQEPMTQIPTPLGGTSVKQIVEQLWYRDFITNMERPVVFALLTAANYMGVTPLLDLAVLRVTFELTGKSAEETREILNLPELTPEEPLIALPPVPHRPPDMHNAARNRLIQVQDEDGSIAEERAYLLEASKDVEKAYVRWPQKPTIRLQGRDNKPDRGRIVLANLLLRVPRNDGEIVFVKTPTTVAIKQLHRRDIDAPLMARFLGIGGPPQENPYNEIAVMQYHGDDQHILSCYQALWDADFLYIVMSYAQDGDLFSLIDWRLGGGYHVPNQVPQVAKQVAENLQYLEDRDLVHRNLKPENILRTTEGFPFIGCAMSLQIARLGGNRQLIASQGKAGSMCYISPEVFRLQPFDHKADVWAYGSVLFNLLTGLRFCEMPSEEDVVYSFFITQGGLQDENLRETRLQELLNNGGGNSHLGQCIQAVQALTPVARELLTRILNPNPQNRPDMDAIITHPFFDNVP